MAETSVSFIDIALSRKVFSAAIKIALVVGSLLALINHGDAILAMEVSVSRWFQIGLSYLVPYSVSTYSAVRAVRTGC